MQLSIFDSVEARKKFQITECDSNYESLTDDKGFIKHSFWIKLTKEELLEILATSDKNVRHLYAWSVYYQKNNKYWELTAIAGRPMRGGSTGGFNDIVRYVDAEEWEEL